MDKNFIIIMVMCATRKEAQNISGKLLKKRMIACANILSGVESKFWWKGKINKAGEILVMMKTKKENFRKIESEIKRLHSYEVPEIIAVQITAGSKAYLNWIDEITSPGLHK